MAKPSPAKAPDGSKSAAATTAKTRKAKSTPMLEWAAAAVGAVLTLSLVGALLADVLKGDGRPPEFLVRKVQTVALRDGHLVKIEVRNIGDEPAEQVEIEGLLRSAQGEERVSLAFDEIPARSSRHGGLIFNAHPDDGQLKLKAKAYIAP
jgi:uncharacterized protein (TIGR02588 family)